MIDIQRGSIHFNNKKFALYPGITTQQFQQSDLIQDVISEQHNVFSKYTLNTQEIGSKRFIMSLIFNQINILNIINLYITDDGKVNTWDFWSEAKERIKKEEHDKWLEQYIGIPPYKYLWGEISSDYDPRSGSSMITIRYY